MNTIVERGDTEDKIMFNRILSALLGFPLVFVVLVFGNTYIVAIMICIIAITTIYEFIHVFSGKEKHIKYIANLVGTIYIVGFMAFIPILYGIENGKIYIWYLMFAAWGTDIFALIVGKTLGKHKLCKISPSKTIEGSIGGIIGCLLFIIPYTVFVNNYFGLNISYLYIIIIGILLSILGQIGDILASAVKRYVGIKDFSNLIPGHRRNA